MNPIKLNVSQEYLDTLCESMISWCQLETSLTISQFQEEYGLSYFYLKTFCQLNEKVKKCFEIMKAVLCNRWLKLAMDKDNMPPHQAKVLMRYLRLYDSHGLDVEHEQKKELAEISGASQRTYTLDNYAEQTVQEPFDKFYNANINKRRSSK